MKIYQIIPVLLLFLLASCGGDDDTMTADCAQSNWLGTFTGTEVCPAGTFDVTITVAANGSDKINISYVSSSGTTASYSGLPITDCTANDPAGDLSATLSGNTLKLVEPLGGGENCNFTATK